MTDTNTNHTVKFATRRVDTNSGDVIEHKVHTTAIDAVMYSLLANQACARTGYSPDTTAYLIEDTGHGTLEAPLDGHGTWEVI